MKCELCSDSILDGEGIACSVCLAGLKQDREELIALRAEVAELRKDRERWRYIKNEITASSDSFGDAIWMIDRVDELPDLWTEKDLPAAFEAQVDRDAAIAAAGEKGDVYSD